MHTAGEEIRSAPPRPGLTAREAGLARGRPRRKMMNILVPLLTFLALAVAIAFVVLSPEASGADAPGIPVTVDNFVRAETDMHLARYAEQGAFGRFLHTRAPAGIEREDEPQPNRDLLASHAVLDLRAGPVRLSLPQAGRRFMAVQVINQDHLTVRQVYGAGLYTVNEQEAGTRYVLLTLRILIDPQDARDIAAANALQDETAITQQAGPGAFEAPNWDAKSRKKLRQALRVLGESITDTSGMVGAPEEIDPLRHLIGAAVAWGCNPPSAELCLSARPERNDGRTVHRLTVREVPADGCWSISVYDARGFVEGNPLGRHSVNSLGMQHDADGACTIWFGACRQGDTNCLPIMRGWSYAVRLYRPRPEALDGRWRFPEPEPLG